VFSIETQLLIAVARIIGVKSILELGTGLGYTAMHLAQNTVAEIQTVDLVKKRTVFRELDCKARIEQINTPVGNVSPRPMDMVFCDINPTLAMCRICTDLAFGCKPRVIAWHDYKNFDYPAQTENMDGLAMSHNIYHVEDTRLCFWFEDGREF